MVNKEEIKCKYCRSRAVNFIINRIEEERALFYCGECGKVFAKRW